MRFARTLVFVLRWDAVRFLGGLGLAVFAAYQLAMYVEPAAVNSSPLAGVASPLVEGIFTPAMWLFLIVGLILCGRAFAHARGMVGK